MKFDFKGIGTTWLVDIFSEDQDLHVINDIIQIVEEFEMNYSRFRPSSLISVLNQNKRLVNPPKELLEIISIAENLRQVSNGAFDIRVGSRLQDLGYDKNYSFKPKATIYHKDNSEIILNSKEILIGKSSNLDLGGIGKGFLIDKVSNFLIENKILDFTINAGGDIRNSGASREFFLENPFDSKEYIGSINIANAGIASSGIDKRRWKFKDKELNHLINIESGESIVETAAVFVLGKNALHADLASTAIFVSNQNIWQNIVNHLEVSFLVVFQDGSFFKMDEYPGNLNIS